MQTAFLRRSKTSHPKREVESEIVFSATIEFAGERARAHSRKCECPVTLVEYGDYERPHYGMASPIVDEIRREMGDAVRFVFRNFPLTEVHPHAELEANGIRFAYRRFGKIGNVPLVFLQYFAGNMDNWDPTVTNGFATDREVIMFDDAGVGSSGSETPNSVKEMARDCLTFLGAVGLERIDVVGFSLGEMIAQQLALDRPQILRRIMLLGTGPSGGEGMTFTELSVAETQMRRVCCRPHSLLIPLPARLRERRSYKGLGAVSKIAIRMSRRSQRRHS